MNDFTCHILTSFFLQIHKILNFKKITFSFITFDSDDLQECTIPQNNGLNQNNLVSFIANFSKTTVNMLKTGICQSQILGIPLYIKNTNGYQFT